MAGFRFDEERHEYWLGERRLPTVSAIAREMAGEQFTGAGEWHLNRGRVVHRAIALYLQGRLDESSVDERIRGRLEAAKKAIRDFDLAGGEVRVEVPMCHPRYLYGGTPDLFVPTAQILVDWKSAESRATEPQMGGYIELLCAMGLKVLHARSFVLRDDGTYTMGEYETRRARGLFLAGLTCYNWRHA